jgi:hypothetical protein
MVMPEGPGEGGGGRPAAVPRAVGDVQAVSLDRARAQFMREQQQAQADLAEAQGRLTELQTQLEAELAREQSRLDGEYAQASAAVAAAALRAQNPYIETPAAPRAVPPAPPPYLAALAPERLPDVPPLPVYR